MLTNKIYIGIKTFKDGDSVGEVKAVWDAIIDEEIFQRVHLKLKSNFRKKKPHSKSRYPYLLSGITYCLSCGDTMCGKSAHGNGGKIGYYEHSWATKRNSTLTKKTFKCSPHRVLAKKLEPLVIEKVEELIFGDELAKSLFEKIKNKDSELSSKKEVDSLKAQVYGINSQIDALTERLSELPKELSAAPIYKQMKGLEERKLETENQLELLMLSDLEIDYRANLKDFTAFSNSLREVWLTAGPKIKSRIIQRLVYKVEVGEDSVVVHFNVDKRNLGPKTKKASDLEAFLSRPNFFYHNGSNSLTNGARRGT